MIRKKLTFLANAAYNSRRHPFTVGSDGSDGSERGNKHQWSLQLATGPGS